MANSRARSFDAFQPGLDNWTEWKERLDFYLEAEGITDNDKKRSVLLTVCGKETYSLVKNLVAPNNVKDKSFEQIVSLLDRHLQPKLSVTVARFKFKSGLDLGCTLRDRRTRCSVFAVLPFSARLCDVWHDSHRLFCTQAIVDDHLSTFARNIQLSSRLQVTLYKCCDPPWLADQHFCAAVRSCREGASAGGGATKFGMTRSITGFRGELRPTADRTDISTLIKALP